MSSKKSDQEAFKYEERFTSYGPRKKWGFYRPHTHHGFDNCDPNTGEVLPSMTRQSEMDACDIHNILKQFSQQGFEALVRERASLGQYADLTALPDYQDALNTVLSAQSAFAALPSQVRERFSNDPARFVQFLADPANVQEAIRLGLAEAREMPATPPTGGEGGSPPSEGAKAP